MSTKERKQREKENRRETILEAAEKIMLANGLHGLSIDLIAQETELAKGTIYLYFKSKEEILSILTVRARRWLLKEFKQIQASDLGSIEKLKAIVRVNFDFKNNYPLYYDLFSLYEAYGTLTETEEMLQSSNDIAEAVAEIAAEAQADGLLNSSLSPEILTWCFYGMTVGMAQLIKVRGSFLNHQRQLSEEELVNSFLVILEDGIKK